MSDVENDPGWSGAFSFRTVTTALMPGLAATKVHNENTLERIRAVYLSSIATLFLILVAAWLVLDGETSVDEPGWLLLVAGTGLLDIGLTWWARSRPLDASDEGTLASSFTATFFLGYALTMSPALIGFVVGFIEDSITPLLVGLGFSALALVINAPTRAAVQRRQEQIARNGSTLSVTRALMSPAEDASRETGSAT